MSIARYREIARMAKKDNRWNEIDGGSAFVIPYTLLRHVNFKRLSARALKLLMDLARQFTGYNNGFLCASWSLMKDAGWNSSETLWLAVRECEHFRVIARTQQGGRNRPNLFAFTWRRIDHVKDRSLDIAPTIKPLDTWKQEQPDFDPTLEKARKPRHRKRRKATPR